jgi:hypothetical protein
MDPSRDGIGIDIGIHEFLPDGINSFAGKGKLEYEHET